MSNGYFEKGDRVIGMLGGVARHGVLLEMHVHQLYMPYLVRTYFSVAFDDGVTCHTMTQAQLEPENPLDSIARCGE